MSAIRPGLPQSLSAQGLNPPGARTAQAAFFRAALDQAAAPRAAAPAAAVNPPVPRVTPIRTAPDPAPETGQPTRLLRPGSLLDIRI